MLRSPGEDYCGQEAPPGRGEMQWDEMEQGVGGWGVTGDARMRMGMEMGIGRDEIGADGGTGMPLLMFCARVEEWRGVGQIGRMR